jgi:hypothetical protein
MFIYLLAVLLSAWLGMQRTSGLTSRRLKFHKSLNCLPHERRIIRQSPARIQNLIRRSACTSMQQKYRAHAQPSAKSNTVGVLSRSCRRFNHPHQDTEEGGLSIDAEEEAAAAGELSALTRFTQPPRNARSPQRYDKSSHSN